MRKDLVKLVVFSDVHGNAMALRAMLSSQEFKSADGTIFLGDAVGYYFDELEVITLLQGIPKLLAVQGNHDAYYQKKMSEIERCKLVQKYGPCYIRNEKRVTSYLSELPLQGELQVANKSIYFCHGSPMNPLEGRIYPDTKIKKQNCVADIVLCGHTHYRMYRNEQGYLFINPGSLGQPRDGNGFSYCTLILEEQKVQVNFHTVFIDIKKLEYDCVQRRGTNYYGYTILKRNGA